MAANGADSSANTKPVALITGSGAPRVGRVIAEHLSTLGYAIAVHARNSTEQAQQFAEQITKQEGEAIVCHGDLRDAANCERIVQQVIGHWRRIDVLVNSAAIWHPTALEDVTADELREYFDTNVLASFLCARAAGLQMVAQPGGGSIVNLSDWALCRPYLDHAAYFPSKGAVEAMTRSLAVELGHRNPRVRVNCIAPGPVLLGDGVSDAQRRETERGLLVQRLGTPSHLAHATQFLIENDFVTGVVLPVDGGRSIFAQDPLQLQYRTG